jgi:tetratricopeptide (TPR) repeat protein
MKGVLAHFLLALLLSCGKDRVDDETLLLYTRSSAAYSQGRFDEAARMLAGVASFPPALVLRGKGEYFSDDPVSAEKSLRRALALNPASEEARLFLARLLREKGETGEAAALAETLLRDNPQDIRTLRLAADLARERGEAGEAAALLDRAAEASAETALVFLDRARSRWIGGNGPGALEDLERAEILLPWDTPLTRSIGQLRSTILSASQKPSSEKPVLQENREAEQ